MVVTGEVAWVLTCGAAWVAAGEAAFVATDTDLVKLPSSRPARICLRSVGAAWVVAGEAAFFGDGVVAGVPVGVLRWCGSVEGMSGGARCRGGRRRPWPLCVMGSSVAAWWAQVAELG